MTLELQSVVLNLYFSQVRQANGSSMFVWVFFNFLFAFILRDERDRVQARRAERWRHKN